MLELSFHEMYVYFFNRRLKHGSFQRERIFRDWADCFGEAHVWVSHCPDASLSVCATRRSQSWEHSNAVPVRFQNTVRFLSSASWGPAQDRGPIAVALLGHFRQECRSYNIITLPPVLCQTIFSPYVELETEITTAIFLVRRPIQQVGRCNMLHRLWSFLFHSYVAHTWFM